MSIAGPGKIIQDGLVLYLDASNTKSYVSGSTSWVDISRNNNSGSLINGPTFSSDNKGGIVFDGTNDYVIVSSGSTIPVGSSPRSVSIWFYTNSTSWTSNVNNLFFYGSNSNGRAFGIDMDEYPKMEVFTWGAAGRDLIFTSSYSLVGWKNISVTYNGATSILIYENGTLTQTLTLTSAADTANTNVYIGAINPSILSGYFDGRIAQVSIYNRTLSAIEVLQNYNVEKKKFGLS